MLTGFAQAGIKGFTDEQAAMACDAAMHSFWKRASELRARDFIEPVMKKGDQEFRQSRAGGHQGVWKITPAGRQQLKAWSKSI
jgi:hypothetical protein